MPGIFWLPGAVYRLLLHKRSYLRRTGWTKSLRRGIPVDSDGGFIPWMNYAVISVLESRLSSSMRVFEYGSGYSSFFFGERTGEVVSVEYDKKWFTSVSKLIPGNCRVIYRQEDEDGHYCRSIQDLKERFHLVIIDGRDRVNCVRYCSDHLTADGVVILDDSHREKYSDAFTIMRDLGFRELTFSGIKPGEYSRHDTTVFYRDGNCLGF